MSEKYQICLVKPEGYVHSLCFQEVALLLKSSLRSIGVECENTINRLAGDRINVILGYHLLRFDKSLTKCRYIPYQLEQLDAKEGWYSENIRQLLENAYEVWDYSKENIEFLGELDIKAKHLPIGYHRDLETIEHAPEKDIDVLFYGSVGKRRKVVLDKLSSIARVKTLFGAYGKERDDIIARAKIILNIHHYSVKIFEAIRISYLLNNKCFVVSETSPVNPYKDSGLCMVPYDGLVETCRHYLNEPGEIEQARIDSYNAFKANYPMAEFVKRVI
jgi:hypothetical protein